MTKQTNLSETDGRRINDDFSRFVFLCFTMAMCCVTLFILCLLFFNNWKNKSIKNWKLDHFFNYFWLNKKMLLHVFQKMRERKLKKSRRRRKSDRKELTTTTTGRCGVESTTSRTATSDWVLYISFYSVSRWRTERALSARACVSRYTCAYGGIKEREKEDEKGHSTFD